MSLQGCISLQGLGFSTQLSATASDSFSGGPEHMSFQLKIGRIMTGRSQQALLFEGLAY